MMLRLQTSLRVDAARTAAASPDNFVRWIILIEKIKVDQVRFINEIKSFFSLKFVFIKIRKQSDVMPKKEAAREIS